MRHFAITGMETAFWMPLIIFGSLIRDTPPAARMSAGMRSSAITAQAPAASAIFACTVTALLLLWENYAVTLALSILLGIVILFAFIMYYIKIFRGKYGLKTPRQP